MLLLNNDTIVQPQALAQLLRFMDEHPSAGACGPRLLQVDGTPQPYAFGKDPSLSYLIRRGLSNLSGWRRTHDWGSDELQEVDWISGACMMLRRKALQQVGLLDEGFFMYFEDNDLCYRLRRASWQVFYNPQAAITHLGGQSLKLNPQAQSAYHQSLCYFYRKHYSRVATVALVLSLWAYHYILASGIRGRLA